MNYSINFSIFLENSGSHTSARYFDLILEKTTQKEQSEIYFQLVDNAQLFGVSTSTVNSTELVNKKAVDLILEKTTQEEQSRFF